MKIIFCRWNSICERGYTRGFQQLGVDIVALDRRFTSVDYDKEYLVELSKLIVLNRDAEAVFSVNFMPIIARVCQQFNIKYICQTSDGPVFQLYSETLKFSTNRVFLFDRAQYNRFVSVNPDNIFYLPLACDINYWDNIKVSADDYKKYGCDVSFVGSLYSEKCMYNAVENELPDYMKGYARGLMEAQTKVYGYFLLGDAVSEEWALEFKKYVKWNPLASDYEEDVKDIVTDMYLGQKCTEMERIRIFQAISEGFKMDLWTQSDCSMLPKINNRGAAHSENVMPKVLKCSKININHTNRTIKTGLPLRIFDVLGCGGFLISNYQEEIPELFEVDKDIVLFESTEDLLEKIDYYLKHEDERLEIAASGYNKVKNYYTYAHILQKMLIASGLNFSPNAI